MHSALLAKQIYTGTQVCFARSALCTLKLHLRALVINNSIHTCCCNGGKVGREMGILLLLLVLMTVMTIKVTTPFIPVLLVIGWAVSLLLLLMMMRMMMVIMVMMMKVIPVVLVERWAGSRLCNRNNHCQHPFDNL